MWFHLSAFPLDLCWFLEWAAAWPAKNNLLFAAIYLNLSKRQCRNTRCYGFHRLPLVCMYTRLRVQWPIVLPRYRWESHISTSLTHGHVLFPPTPAAGARELQSVRRLGTSHCRNLADAEFISTFLCVRPEVSGENTWLRFSYTKRRIMVSDRDFGGICVVWTFACVWWAMSFPSYEMRQRGRVIGQRMQGERMPGNCQFTRPLRFSSLCVHSKFSISVSFHDFSQFPLNFISSF